MIEYYLDVLGRPEYTPAGELKRAGEDLAAKGVTEYLWDVVYATWICLGLVGVAGEWAWWVALVVPAYGLYLGWGLYKGFSGMGGVPGMPAGKEDELESRKQKRKQARGGEKVRYR